MGILEDFSRRRAQELRNDQPTAETDQPSSQSTDDPTNNLEFVDRSDQKKNRVPGPHGDSVNKTAQNPFHVAQVKETGHVGGDMADNETAETGHIGGNNPMTEGHNGGGRTPGNISNPDSVPPTHHDRENNAEREQIT